MIDDKVELAEKIAKMLNELDKETIKIIYQFVNFFYIYKNKKRRD